MSESPIHRAILELRKELARLDQVIRMLETLSIGKPRRGRPPKVLVEAMRAAGINTSKRRR
jgi:hypothetical protein